MVINTNTVEEKLTEVRVLLERLIKDEEAKDAKIKHLTKKLRKCHTNVSSKHGSSESGGDNSDSDSSWGGSICQGQCSTNTRHDSPRS